MVDQVSASLHVLADTLLTEHHPLNIMWVAEHKENIVRLLGNLDRCHHFSA